MYEAWFVIGLLLKLGRGCSLHRKVCRGVCTSVCYVYANILLYILICMVVEKRGSLEPRCYLRSGCEYRSLMCSLRKKCTFTIFCHPLLRLQRAAGSCWCMVLHPGVLHVAPPRLPCSSLRPLSWPCCSTQVLLVQERFPTLFS